MKKALSLILALALCLSLCACGSSISLDSTEAFSLKDAVIGTWVYNYQLKESATLVGQAGDNYSKTIELYKGGTGRVYWKNETSGKDSSNVSLTWEIVDDVVNITYSIADSESAEGFEYNIEADTLTKVDGSAIEYVI